MSLVLASGVAFVKFIFKDYLLNQLLVSKLLFLVVCSMKLGKIVFQIANFDVKDFRNVVKRDQFAKKISPFIYSCKK